MAILSLRNSPTGSVHEQKSGPNISNVGIYPNGDGGSQAQDEADMARLGVQQETKRRFGLLTILGFTTTMMCTWESALPFFTPAFLNGGGATMIYGYIFAFFGALATCASMAEMASMYPISGGQYHWVALLAPKRHAKFLSWLTGWISTLGWQASTATGTYLGGTIIQGLLALDDSSYFPKRWHATLILYAVLLLTIIANTVLVKLLPSFEGLILIFHVVGFFAIMITLVHLSPISPTAFVFREFTSMSGYTSGTSWLIGQASSAVLFIGYDGACHMAEEVKNASTNVPRAMFFTIFINGAFGFAMYIVILFCFGNVDDTLNTKTQFPFIQIFYNATQSKAGATVMTSILIAMYVFATFGFLASASRQAWAFSRDNGLPFSGLLKRINRRLAIPLWAIAFTGVMNALLALINIGSSVAFNAIVSLVTSSYLSSYLISIVLLILKRLEKEPIPFGPWTLGRWGLGINIFATLYTTLTVVFSFFPPTLPANKTTMNYSCVVYGGVIILGLIFYVVYGHRHYRGPNTPATYG